MIASSGKNKSTEVYYWSKLDDDEKLAGGDIRAMHVIPEMMRISERKTLLVVPEELIRKKFLTKHQSTSKIFLVFLVPISIIKAVVKQKYQIRFIYCSTCYPWDTLPAIFIKKIFDTKIVCISHDTPKQLSGYEFYRINEKFSIVKSMLFTAIGKFQNFLLRYVDVPIGLSEFAMDFFRTPNVRGRAIMSSNPIDTILSEGEINNPRTYDIVILGRIIPRKNVQKIIKTFRNRSYERRLKILVITNSTEETVEREIRRYIDYECIELTCKYSINENQKLDLLKQSKIYISLSMDENFSIATLEAASMGTALILSDYPFFKNIYGQSAIYVDENDPDELWNQVCNLLNDKERLRYSKNAIRVASHYLSTNVASNDYYRIEERLNSYE